MCSYSRIGNELYARTTNLVANQRDIMHLSASSSCYTAIGSEPGPPTPPYDAHAILMGGLTDGVSTAATITELTNKPMLGFGGPNDDLSNKV